MLVNYVGPIRDEEPTVLPLNTADLRAQARIDSNADDALLEEYIKAATEMVEAHIGKSLLEQTWKLWLNGGFPPCGKAIVIPHSPVLSIDKIYYVNLDGEVTELAADQYQTQVEGSNPQILPAYGLSWPSARSVLKAVRVEFTAGYGESSESVPYRAKQAIRLIVASFYEKRELFVPEMAIEKHKDFPILKMLLGPLRTVRFASL